MLLSLLLQHGEAADAPTPSTSITGVIFWTVLIFVILMGLLWRFAWPSILKSVEERERRIQKQLEDAEKATPWRSNCSRSTRRRSRVPAPRRRT